MTENALKRAREVMDFYILSKMAGGGTFGITETYYRLSLFEGEFMTRDMARGFLRDLTDKGFCRYGQGLFCDDGQVAGSGYAITQAGLDYWKQLNPAKRIRTSFDCPPIPYRSMDWSARFSWQDGDSDLYGQGETEESAMIDLVQKAIEFDGDGSEQEEVVELALMALVGISEVK